MDFIGALFILFILIWLLGLLFRFALPGIVAGPLALLEKLKKLGMPKWIFWILGFIVVWGGVIFCVFIIGYIAQFFGL
tara:strand:- start:311 stop:544 length:234 start_codon:yes stop_codon:yes gene_type:complete